MPRLAADINTVPVPKGWFSSFGTFPSIERSAEEEILEVVIPMVRSERQDQRAGTEQPSRHVKD